MRRSEVRGREEDQANARTANEGDIKGNER